MCSTTNPPGQGLHPAVASALNNLGAVCKAQGNLDEAGKAYQVSAPINAKQLR